MSINASDVFVPTHLPSYTLVTRNDDHTDDIKDALTDRMLVSVSGPSKSGKTVLVESAVGDGKLIDVTGAGIEKPDDVWRKVLDKIGAPESRVVTTAENDSESTSSTVGANIGPRFLSTSVRASTVSAESDSRSEAKSYKRDLFNYVVEYLSGSDNVLFLDDFHYIPQEVQKVIAQQVKELVRNKISVVYASVPYHSDDIIRVNSDLQGRLFKVDMSYWTDDELKQIINYGFDALNFTCSENTKDRLVKEASGSPQLMQSLCLALCRVMKSRESHDKSSPAKDITPNEDQFLSTCRKVVQTTDYDNLISKLLEGVPTRGKPRKLYKLKDGTSGDVYRITLRAMKQDPATMIIRYNELYSRVESICSDVPMSTGITQACVKLSEISATHINGSDELNDETAVVSTMLIEFDSEDSVIAIRDPYLLYAIRWSTTI